MKITATFEPGTTDTQVSTIKTSLGNALQASQSVWSNLVSFVRGLLIDGTYLNYLQLSSDSNSTLNHYYISINGDRLDLWGRNLNQLADWDKSSVATPGFSISSVQLTSSNGNVANFSGALGVTKGELTSSIKSVGLTVKDNDSSELGLSLTTGTGTLDSTSFSQAVMSYQGIELTATGKLSLDGNITESLSKIQLNGLENGSGKTGNFAMDFGTNPSEGGLWDALKLNNYFGGNAQFQSIYGVPSYFEGNDDVTWLQATGNTTDPYLNLGAGNDKLLLGSYDDIALGGSGNDTLQGADGNDFLIGDELSYNTIAKHLFSSLSGNDSLLGGVGNDTLIGGLGNDVLDGGDGIDTASYIYAKAAVQVDLVGNKSAGADGKDSLKNIENLMGSIYADKLTGNNLANLLNGDAGADTLQGGDGNDTLIGGDGYDSLSGGTGDDLLGGDVENGNDRISGDAGNDSLYGGNGDDWLSGDAGNDLLKGGKNNDTLNGGDGNDSLNGEEGNDSLSGGAGDDELLGGAGYDNLSGNAGNDTLKGGEGDDVLNGGDGSDYLYGDAGNDYLTGGAGVDYFVMSSNSFSEFDVVTDFKSGEDKLQLASSVFSVVSSGVVSSDFLVGIGKALPETGQHLIYNTTNGALYYDADGLPTTQPVLIVILGTSVHPLINYADFIVV